MRPRNVGATHVSHPSTLLQGVTPVARAQFNGLKGHFKKCHDERCGRTGQQITDFRRGLFCQRGGFLFDQSVSPQTGWPLCSPQAHATFPAFFLSHIFVSFSFTCSSSTVPTPPKLEDFYGVTMSVSSETLPCPVCRSGNTAGAAG